MVASLAPAAADAAETALTRSEEQVVNFGFATQLGSGVYSMSGRTLQVYRLPFSYDLNAAEGARRRVKITLPVTLGLINFEPRDVIETGLPEQLDSISFVPGVSVELDVRDDWRIEPYAEAGLARDRTGDYDTRVYTVGLRSRYDRRLGPLDGELYAELVHCAIDQQDPDYDDDFTSVRLGLSGRHAFGADGWRARTDFLAYGFVDWLIDTAEGSVNAEPGSGDEHQYEVGVTFGSIVPAKLWGIPLPRIGLGYRFGEELSVVRVVFGTPF